MSFYTDWFLADEADAERLATADEPFESWPSLSLKSIGDIDLMQLWAILQNKEFDAADEVVTDELLFQDADEEVFVVRVKPDFLDALAFVKDANIPQIVEAWKKTETLRDATNAELGEVIHKLRAFARRSIRRNKTVLSLFSL